MKTRTLVIAALLAGWWAAVWKWWDANIPSVPTAVVPMDRHTVVRGLPKSGEFLVMRENKNPPKRNQLIFDPELCFWSFPEARITRRFTAATPIRSAWPLNDELIAVRELDRLRIINLETLTDVAELDHKALGLVMAGPSNQLVAYLDESRRVVVRNLETNRQIWSSDGPYMALYPSSHFVLAISQRPIEVDGRPVRMHAVILDPETGERITRFDAIGPVHVFRTQRNSPYAIAYPPGKKTQICDVQTGRSLAEFEHFGQLEFSEDGQSIVEYRCDGEGRGHVARWPDAVGASSVQTMSNIFSHSTRRTNDVPVIDETIEAYRAPGWVMRGLSSLQAKLNISIEIPKAKSRRIVDLRTGRILVNFGTDSPKSDPTIALSPSGVVLTFPKELRYYSIPARRNWLWLLTWSLLPPAGLVLLQRTGRRMWSSLRQNRTAEKTAAVQQAM